MDSEDSNTKLKLTAVPEIETDDIMNYTFEASRNGPSHQPRRANTSNPINSWRKISPPRGELFEEDVCVNEPIFR